MADLNEAKALQAKCITLIQIEYGASNQIASAGQLVDLIRNNRKEEIPKPTVQSIMEELGLKATRMSARLTTTVRDHQTKTAQIKKHMLDKRDFRSSRLGAKLVGKFTYLRACEGWLFLKTVIDLY